jgi:hypothetical protein
MRNASAVILLFLAVSVSGQAPADFTGHWLQETNSRTQRHLDVEQDGQKLHVKTMVTDSQGTRLLDVTYEIGGRETTYTGLDGDEFHSSVRWDGTTLVFDIIEREGESKIPQKTVWTLSEDNNTLQADRRLTKSGETKHSLTQYVRQH